MSNNIKVTKDTLNIIRSLEDFDLTMLLSEIQDHGWSVAEKLVPMIQKSRQQEQH